VPVVSKLLMNNFAPALSFKLLLPAREDFKISGSDLSDKTCLELIVGIPKEV